ncbi:MAG: hypothetical protein GF307_00690 [candidate division Zixibacteria bacterium]|nr:hypothetical protein [candidate division Zixibacteria bacterium]
MKRVLFVLIILLLVAVAGVYIYPNQKTANVDLRNDGPKVAIIGLDGLGWDLVDPLLADGDLPNLESYINGGVKGDLVSFEFHQLLSPLIWTTIVTGKMPEKHGIQAWWMYDETADQMRVCNARDRTCRAVWEIVSDYGYTNMFINFMCSFPPDSVNGVLISDRAVYSAANTMYPPSAFNLNPDLFTKARRKIFGKKKGLEFFEGFYNKNAVSGTEEALRASKELSYDEMKMIFKNLQEETENELKLFNATMDKLDEFGQPNLFGFYLHGPDMAQHLLFRFHEPSTFNVSEKEVEIFGGFLTNYLKMADSLTGELVNALDPETNIIIISDHALEALTDKSIPESSGPVNNFKEIFPTRGGRTIQRGVNFEELRNILNEIFEADSIRFKIATPSYLTFRQYSIESYWQLLDNSGEKITDPAIISEAVNTLQQIEAENIGPLFVKTEADSDSRLMLHINPELYPESGIIYNGQTWSAGKLIVLRNELSAWHERRGIIIAKGPAFKDGIRYLDGKVEDITPTLLYLMGIPVANDMDGKIMYDIFTDEFNNNTKTRFVSTHENNDSRRFDFEEIAGEDETIDKLKALGYIR